MNIPPPLPSGLSIRGRALVTSLDCELPEVCVFTGRTDDLVRVRQRISWHHPAIYLTIFIGLIIYVVLALALRKSANVAYYINREEKARRQMWHAANWGVFLSTFLWIALGVALGWTWAFWVIPVSLLSSIVIYFLQVQRLFAWKIDGQAAEVGGIPAEVMEKLVAA